jgi:hypothetical protein
MATDFRQTPEWVKGDAVQRTAADLFRQEGWYVIPSYDYSGDDERAPRLQGQTKGYAIPDLDVARRSTRIWVEVKAKEGPTFSTKDQEWQHGMNARLFEHYRHVQGITGTPVWILIHEERDNIWLAASLDNVAGNIRPRRQNRMVKNGRTGPEMVYFPRSIFKRVFPNA